MSKYTPEPWSLDAHGDVTDKNDNLIAQTAIFMGDGRRIVACVNACAPDGPVAALIEAADAVLEDHDVQRAVGTSSEAQYKLRTLAHAVTRVEVTLYLK